jgi:hypothetical protein
MEICHDSKAVQTWAPEAVQNNQSNSLPFYETPGVKLVGHLEVLSRVNGTSFTKVEQTVIEKPVLLSFQGFVMPYDIVG